VAVLPSLNNSPLTSAFGPATVAYAFFKDEGPLLACAVKRRRFPVGASPTRQPLQPEATGAVMEVTKCLKRASSEGWLDQQEADLPGQKSEAP
jgi:hypothetical protein